MDREVQECLCGSGAAKSKCATGRDSTKSLNGPQLYRRPWPHAFRKRPRASSSARLVPCACRRGRQQARPRSSASAPASLAPGSPATTQGFLSGSALGPLPPALSNGEIKGRNSPRPGRASRSHVHLARRSGHAPHT
ncbi:hypothetical protein NDU88_006245 [Pleurodeles waltl]|uniref:Uncharacterized protein n=1 Tax=Pleurodeles waltl TaxID=8319 RepID=A0AAV7TCX5_PLEWA|nr:hypothetical protein NDU88_006245 [Pleurodeles waltl]